MVALAQTDFETFWRLCQAAYRAEETKEKNNGTLGSDAYAHTLDTTLRRAVWYDRDTVLEVTRAARANLRRLAECDFWYDGCVAGYDKAIHILQGGV